MGENDPLLNHHRSQDWYSVKRVQEGESASGREIRLGPVKYGDFATWQTPNKLGEGTELMFPSLFTPPKPQDTTYVHERFERLKVTLRACLRANQCLFQS